MLSRLAVWFVHEKTDFQHLQSPHFVYMSIAQPKEVMLWQDNTVDTKYRQSVEHPS
jgi:hypothetical protein